MQAHSETSRLKLSAKGIMESVEQCVRWVCAFALGAPMQHAAVSSDSGASSALIARSPTNVFLLFRSRVVTLFWVFMCMKQPAEYAQDAASLFRAVVLAPQIFVAPQVAAFRLVLSRLDHQLEFLSFAKGTVHLPAVTLRIYGTHDHALDKKDFHHWLLALAARAVCIWACLVRPRADTRGVTSTSEKADAPAAGRVLSFLAGHAPCLCADTLASHAAPRARQPPALASAHDATSLALIAKSPVNVFSFLTSHVAVLVLLCLCLSPQDPCAQRAAFLFQAVALAPQVFVVVPPVAAFRLLGPLLHKLQMSGSAVGTVRFPAATLRFLGLHDHSLKSMEPQNTRVALAARVFCLLASLLRFKLPQLSACLSEDKGSSARPRVRALGLPREEVAGTAAPSAAWQAEAPTQRPLCNSELAAQMSAQLQELQRMLSKQEAALQREMTVSQQLRADLEASEDRLRHALQQAEEAKRDAEEMRHAKEALEVKLRSIFEDLAQICTCPLTMQAMDDPALAPDLRTYELSAIRQWLEEKRSSPFTRLPMCAGALRANRAVHEVQDIVRRHWPSAEAPRRPREQLLPVLQPVGSELSRVMAEEDESAVLELLTRPIEDSVLNNLYEVEDAEYTLLQLAIFYGYPRVACAIASRPDFRRATFLDSNGLAAIHMAAMVGNQELCKIISDDLGSDILASKTFNDAVVTLESGETFEIPAGSTSVSLARSAGHDELAEQLMAQLRSR